MRLLANHHDLVLTSVSPLWYTPLVSQCCAESPLHFSNLSRDVSVKVQSYCCSLRMRVLACRRNPPYCDAGTGEVDYQRFFLRAVEVIKKQKQDADENALKVSSLNGVIEKSKKALLSARMVIKFRDSTIKRLRSADQQQSESEEDAREILRKEIAVLNEQVRLVFCWPGGRSERFQWPGSNYGPGTVVELR